MSSQVNYDAYLPAIKQRWQADQILWESQRLKAHQTAQEIASELYANFSATHVVLFGSVTKPGAFDQYSDIDLAVSGISPDRFFQAVAHALSLGDRFKVDLIDLDDCPLAIREAILQDGEPL